MTRTAYRWTTSGLILSALLSFADIQPAHAQTKDFNVAAQSATTGIPEFARQAGIQILVSEPLVRGKRLAAVTGSHSVEEALAILLDGNRLVATSKDGATSLWPPKRRRLPRGIQQGRRRVGGVAGSAQDVPAGGLPPSPSQNEKPKVYLEEVIVTGFPYSGQSE